MSSVRSCQICGKAATNDLYCQKCGIDLCKECAISLWSESFWKRSSFQEHILCPPCNRRSRMIRLATSIALLVFFLLPIIGILMGYYGG
ncbi:MAG: hypothetical protein ACFFDT_02480 [Candidatus Hodarchaeota archaeon]